MAGELQCHYTRHSVSCINCLEEDAIESSQHFLFECPVFASSMLKYIGEIAGMGIKHLSRFVIDSLRFVEILYLTTGIFIWLYK